MSVCVYLWLVLFFTFTQVAYSQVRPVYDRGAVGLMQMLKRLNTTASVLMIGAHPDDEDTALLAYLARGENARTAYLSLTRGDGGQNIIGPELGEALGVIRTEELLQARRLDGAAQFFTRAYDFGFSKTLEEARAKWDEKVILCDAVRVIRNFRPLVVVSQFSGTPADGHGQHQFAGYISPLAVKAAADATQCKDGGEVWQVKKFYVRHRGTGEPTLRINTGKYDPLLGRSYFEIAMEARSQHKSQEQGVLELKGDQFSQLNLVGSSVKEKGIFDGIDTSITGISKLADGSNGIVDSELEKAQRYLTEAQREFNWHNPSNIVDKLKEALRAIAGASIFIKPILSDDTMGFFEAMRGSTRFNENAKTFIQEKGDDIEEAIIKAHGIRLDLLADKETVVSGETLGTTVNIFYSSDRKVGIRGVGGCGSPVKAESVVTDVRPGFRREVATVSNNFELKIPTEADLTQPYWLAKERNGSLFTAEDHVDFMLPFANLKPYGTTMPFEMGFKCDIELEIDNDTFFIERLVEFRFADDIRGEIRRNVDVVPKVTVEMEQSLMIVPYSDKPLTKQVSMTVTNHSRQPVTGAASLNFNSAAEWKYTSSSKTFELKRTGEKTAITFDVTIPAKTKPGSYLVYGQAMIGEVVANMTMKTIAYPHIQTHRFYRRAVVDAKVIDLKTAPVKVGYIAGSGDRVQDAIRQMGFSVETITESELASGDLSRFDTIVVGIRAYQVRPDVVANNQRLLDYASNGGTLIVQYQLPAYASLAPFTTQMGPRVVDENAAVNLVDPKHPIFNFPNKITQSDFAGWVQERNLYNFTNFGAEYTGLLESHDAGEAENKGGLVIAKMGRGNYVYCSYSMFRQLPAGVPGAYRLFANLLSLPKSR
ncbi:MAG: PIG-L family deacetylase [Pyrinomonadaceae bacterium]